MEAARYTKEELQELSPEALVLLVLSQQEQLSRLNDNIETLIEQIRIANQNRFGRKSEKLDAIDGQMSLFNEAEAYSDESVPEPPEEAVIPAKRRKEKGKRDSDLKDFPAE